MLSWLALNLSLFIFMSWFDNEHLIAKLKQMKLRDPPPSTKILDFSQRKDVPVSLTSANSLKVTKSPHIEYGGVPPMILSANNTWLILVNFLRPTLQKSQFSNHTSFGLTPRISAKETGGLGVINLLFANSYFCH